MKNYENDERGTFDCPNAGTLASPETPLHETLTHELSVVAAQLVEAACKARDGDREATRAHIAHAVALLRGKPSLGPSGIHVLCNLETHVARGGLPAWQTRRVFAHVEANLCRRIAIRELARLLGLSASHFCRAFKCTFGVSPRDYVLRRRIEVAQGLMLTTSEPLSSIAIRCGMCDQPHFTRSFHRIVGETPYTWRRTRQGALRPSAQVASIVKLSCTVG
jgi:AraC family transcriptional regulator